MQYLLYEIRKIHRRGIKSGSVAPSRRTWRVKLAVRETKRHHNSAFVFRTRWASDEARTGSGTSGVVIHFIGK